jgi:hypothetical protein
LKHALLALLLAAPAAAQDRAAEIDFENSLRELEAQQAATAAERKRKEGVIETTLVAMNDGPIVAGRLYAHMIDKGVSVKLGSEVQTDAVSVTVRDGKTTIWLAPSLPAYPRVYAPLIARELAASYYAGMRASAERSYMIRASAGLVWLELGGELSRYPVIEGLTGARVSAVESIIDLWARNDAQTALERAGQADGVPGLYDVPVKTDAERASIEADNKAFVAFLLEERELKR